MNETQVKQRIAKCKQALNDAHLLSNNERFSAAVNRMYYAAFYIVTAYFAEKDWITKTHSGVKTKLQLELTSKKLITSEESKTFSLLFQKRSEFDYDDFVNFTEKKIINLYEKTKTLIQKIETIITIND